MKRSREAALLLCAALIAAVQGQSASGSGFGSGEGSSAFPLPMWALIVICAGGGVLLLTFVTFTCVCCVCCIRKRRNHKSLPIYEIQQHEAGRNGVYRSGSSNSGRSTLSSITHSIANRLLSQTSRAKIDRIDNPTSDLTASTDNSNPLYNSASIAYFPPQTNPRQQKNWPVQDTNISKEPLFSKSPRHSLPYVQMQPARPAREGITSSQSVGDFAESVVYEELERRGSAGVLPASLSYSPPTHSAFASHSVPATRHLFLRPLVTPPPSPTSITASTHTPRTTGEGCEGQEGEDEEDKGGDLYVSPRVFQEDQEQDQERRELEEEDVLEQCYEEVPEDLTIMLTKNRAFVNSYSSDHDNYQLPEQLLPSPKTSRQPSLLSHTETNHKTATEPSYENVESDDAYLSDGYEPINELRKRDSDSDRLVEAADQHSSISSKQQTDSRGDGSLLTREKTGPQDISYRRDSKSLDRKLSLDNQYVEVISPARRAKSMRGHSVIRGDEAAVVSGGHEYQNLIREALFGGVTKSYDIPTDSSTPGPSSIKLSSPSTSQHTVADKRPVSPTPSPRPKKPSTLTTLSSPSTPQHTVADKRPVSPRPSPRPSAPQHTVSPRPSTPQHAGSPRPSTPQHATAEKKIPGSPRPAIKPKPDLPTIPPGSPKSRSSSTGAVALNSTKPHSGSSQLMIVTDQQKKAQRPHKEELFFATQVASGNGHIGRGNGEVAMGSGAVVASGGRWRSTTEPLGTSHHTGVGEGDGEGTREGDGGEVFYANVRGDVGGEELYENVIHLT